MIALLVAVAAADSLTVLFTDARYAEMTHRVAAATHRFGGATHVVALGCPGAECDDCVPVRADESYFELIGHRLAYVARLARAPGAYTGLFVLDSDIMLYRNVAARAERMGADFVFQREQPCAEAHCVNGGVYWLRTRDQNVLSVLDRALELMRTLRLPDQDALQLALAAQPRVAYLPADTHPNGFVHAAATLVGDGLRAARVHLVHANWCADKTDQLRRLAAGRGEWLPSPADTNASAVCELLHALDAPNLATALNCTGARCGALMRWRCP